jgi:hypothetical protein
MNERTTEFGEFWKSYPRRVGKLDAQRAYVKARTQASAAEILDGVSRYIANKPAYADWKHPGAWLRAGRWMDDYAPQGRPDGPQVDWWDECKQLHGGACEERMRHHHRMLIELGS